MNEFAFKKPRWAHLELFGHSGYFGLVQEVEAFGGKLGVIYSLSREGLAEDGMGFGANAIFRITPMSEEGCRRAVLPRSFAPCETFSPAAVLPARCADCGFTEAEHLQRPALGPSPLASSEHPPDSNEESLPPCPSVYRGNECELDDGHNGFDQHQAFVEGLGMVYWTDEDAVREGPPEAHDPGAESSREAQASSLEEPGPDHLRPQ